jgi:hypothetical protein
MNSTIKEIINEQIENDEIKMDIICMIFGHKFEVIEKRMAENGVDGIMFFQCKRCKAKYNDFMNRF